MKKFLLLSFLACILASGSAYAQDVIVKTDNSTILSKVEEISTESIKYRKWDNLDGPVYILNISEVISINYSNGTMETFKGKNTSSTKSDTLNETMDNTNIIATPAEDNDEQKAQYDKLPKLTIKSSQKTSKDFFPIMAFTEESVISTNEVTVVIQPEAVEFYDGGWKVKIGYLISISNKTDAPIYIDRANSFRVFNDCTSKSYWGNKQITVSHGNSKGSGIGVGILGVGVGGAKSSSSSHTETYEIDRFVTIAPHSYANLIDYKYIRLSETRAEFKTVSDIEYWGFDLTSDSPVKVGEVKTYTEDNTPYSNQYYITYSTDPEFKKSYNLQFELYAKWLVGSKLAEETWSNLSPTYRMVKEVQKTVPEFWSESLAIIGMPGQYL